MAISSKPLSFYIGELNSLSTLPPNTYFHRNRDGHFIATGAFGSNVHGIQSVANLYKWRSPAESAQQIHEFAKQLIGLIQEKAAVALESTEPLLQRKTFRQMIFVCQQINQSIKGKVKGGGLGGAPATYAEIGDSKDIMESVIKELKQQAFASLQAIRDALPEKKHLDDSKLLILTTYSYNPEVAPDCPEEKYSDEEWQSAIEHSANLQSEMVGMLQYYGRYSIGLLYNQLRSYLSSSKLLGGGDEPNWDWWNKIGHFENGGLYLSALPVITSTSNFLDEMIREKVGAVLSVTEVFETHSDGYFTSPIKPETYAENGIRHLQIPTPDCETIFFELVMRGVEFIHWNLSNGRSIDVHCKAGRGRSFMIVVCYLIKYQQMNAEEACDLVQKMRPQAGFNKNRTEWETIKTYEKFFLERSYE
jgi:atypical dual specificity phosphatase